MVVDNIYFQYTKRLQYGECDVRWNDDVKTPEKHFSCYKIEINFIIDQQYQN